MTTQISRRDSLQSWRRRVLLAALGSGTWLPQLAAANAPLSALSVQARASFTAVLDQLIPADDLSPSASELGVDHEILETARAIPLYWRLITQSCAWLDQQTPVPFSQLPDETAMELLQWVETLPRDAFPRRFMEIVRNDAMAVYYAHPAAVRGMPVSRPPQPYGYSLD